MTQTISKPEIQKAVKPAPRWRNKWTTDHSYYTVSGAYFEPGEHYGVRIFPSKDTAETWAAYCIEYNKLGNRIQPQWLGAFPIEGDK